jgi:hypothetical protein
MGALGMIFCRRLCGHGEFANENAGGRDPWHIEGVFIASNNQKSSALCCGKVVASRRMSLRGRQCREIGFR